MGEEMTIGLSRHKVVPLVLSDETARAVDMADFIYHRLGDREQSVGLGKFTCCSLGHRRPNGTEMPCDRSRVVALLECMWLAKLAELAEKRSQVMYCALRQAETKMFALPLQEP